MNNLSIDHLIVYTFLAITLLVGLWAGRGIKDIREYAIANRMFGTGALVLTWLATDIAGETVLDMAGSVRTEGILQPLTVLGGCGIALLMQALFFAPKFTYFKGCITMGDVIGQLYRGPSQIITGLLTFFTALCIAGMEITVLGILCETLLGIDYRWGVGIGGLILVLYTGHGGIKSVTFTDMFQFLVLIVVLPVITVTALDCASGLKHVLSQVPSTQFRVFDHPKAPNYLALFLSISIFQFAYVDPALIQRMLMGKTRQQLRNQFFIVASVVFALMLTLSLIGLTSIVLYPEATDTPIVLRIVSDILPVGIKGLAMAGLLAVTMATFDSFLHAAGLTLVHDVIRPLYNRRDGSLNELAWTRYLTFLAGLVTIAVGLMRAEDLYNFVLISYKFTAPLLAFPLFTGVLGLKPDGHAFYIAGGVAIVVLLLADFLLPAELDNFSPLISVVANGIVFLGVHVIRNKGFAIVSRTQEKEFLWKPQCANIFTHFKQFFPTPRLIVKHSQEQVAKYGAPYILLGVFYIVNYIVPYFMWEHDSARSYTLMLYLRFIGAMACGLLVVKDKWPSFLVPYLPIFWYCTLLYCIPFTNTVMFLLTQGSVEWLINVAIAIMFLIVLVDWLSFVLLTVAGIALGFLFYTQVVGPLDIQLDFSTRYLLVYQGIFATLIGLLFARRRQQRAEQQHRTLQAREQASQAQLSQSAALQVKTLKTLEDASTQKLLQVVRSLQTLPTRGEATDRLQATITTLVPIAFQLQGINVKATDYLRLQSKPIVIDQWLKELRDQFRAYNIGQSIRFIHSAQQKELFGDPEHLATLAIKSIAALQEQSTGDQEEEQQPLLLGLEDTWLHYSLPDVATGYVKKVQALRLVFTTEGSLPALAPSYQPDLTTSPVTTATTTQALEQVANERIVKAHYGYAKVTPNTRCYVIPVDLREVRPKDMDKSYMELGVAPVRANDHYKSDQVDAQAQEKAFLEAVAQRSSADIGLVKTALELIKWYHGPVARHSGEPFYLHPLTVAQIVLDY
ncbi:MAG: sodium:solute symporter family protein, partial [Bacteroidota bacterium]